MATKSGTFRVLTGITRADRWTELRAAALALVLERAREMADVVVVDTGFCLEADEELSFDTMAPRRNAATLRSLELADTVFAVGAADSIGVPRLVRGLAELEAAVPQASPRSGAEQGAGLGRGPVAGTAAAGRVGTVRAGAAHQRLPSCGPRRSDAALLGGLAAAGSGPGIRGCGGAIAELVCAPVQQKRRSSVFSSTAKRRLKG